MGKVREPQTTYVVDGKGKKKAIIINIDDYERLMEDLADLSAIATRRHEKSIPWEQVKKRLKRDGLL
jgi:PHD/YefM family antitoxin component YafN of YafNO toxin-antitoxin module